MNTPEQNAALVIRDIERLAHTAKDPEQYRVRAQKVVEHMLETQGRIVAMLERQNARLKEQLASTGVPDIDDNLWVDWTTKLVCQEKAPRRSAIGRLRSAAEALIEAQSIALHQARGIVASQQIVLDAIADTLADAGFVGPLQERVGACINATQTELESLRSWVCQHPDRKVEFRLVREELNKRIAAMRARRQLPKPPASKEIT